MPLNPNFGHLADGAFLSYNTLQKETAAKYAAAKKSLESSQMTYTLQIPEVLLVSSLESIDLELAERASALSEISRLLEVVEETDSLIRHHLSTLRKAATQSERKKSKKPPLYPGQLELGNVAVNSPQSEAALLAEVAEWQFAPALSQQGLE